MKYKLFRSFGELDKRIEEHELIAVEDGYSIENVTSALVAAVIEDLSASPEYAHCEVTAYAPSYVGNDSQKYTYAMSGVVMPPYSPQNIVIEYGIVEEN